ncbi:MAG: hypothetical protein EOP18_11485, partial [Rhizobiaceae bacterium]
MTIFGSTVKSIPTTTFTSSRAKSALFASLSLLISYLFAIGISVGSVTTAALAFHGLISALFGMFGIILLLSALKPTRLH